MRRVTVLLQWAAAEKIAWLSENLSVGSVTQLITRISSFDPDTSPATNGFDESETEAAARQRLRRWTPLAALRTALLSSVVRKRCVDASPLTDALVNFGHVEEALSLISRLSVAPPIHHALPSSSSLASRLAPPPAVPLATPTALLHLLRLRLGAFGLRSGEGQSRRDAATMS
eukprot:Selendium_serpulae@DN3725_c0_g1_i2.p1